MGSAESNKEILEALREVLVDRLKVEAEAVTPQANLFDDLGLDSIDLMSAVMAIEERFEIEVDTSRANEYWNTEVEQNLKAQDAEAPAAEEVPAEQH